MVSMIAGLFIVDIVLYLLEERQGSVHSHIDIGDIATDYSLLYNRVVVINGETRFAVSFLSPA